MRGDCVAVRADREEGKVRTDAGWCEVKVERKGNLHEGRGEGVR